MTASTTNNLSDDLAAKLPDMLKEAATNKESPANKNLEHLKVTIDKILDEIRREAPTIPIGIVDLDTGNGLSGTTRHPEDDRQRQEDDQTKQRKNTNIYINAGEIGRKLLKNGDKFANNQKNSMYQLGTLFHEYSHAFGFDNDINQKDYGEEYLKQNGGHAKSSEVYDPNSPSRWFNDPDMVAAVMIVLLT